MNFREAFRRAFRTMAQTFGGAISGLVVVDSISKTVVLDLGMKLAAAGLSAALAALAAFSMNLGGNE